MYILWQDNLKLYWMSLFFVCLAGWTASAASTPVLDAIRVSDYEEYSHIAIECSALDSCTVRPVLNPSPHIEVRLRDMGMGEVGSYRPVRSDVIGNISLSQDESGRWLVLNIPISANVKTDQIHWNAWKDFITIDLPLFKPNTKAAPSAEAISAFRAKGGYVVILDPGHGGFHSGTTGGRYTKGPRMSEKNVMLDMAYRIKKVMDKDKRVMCLLTRTDDYLPVPFGIEGTSRQTYIDASLTYRVELAKKYQGNLYISLHLNATDNVSAQRDARGYEIYYMGDEKADSLFNSSNMDIRQLQAVGVDKSDEISRLVTKLSKEYVPQSSQLLATSITDRMQDVPGMVFRPKTIISEKSLRVIKQFNMPSVLVEFLFLTHPEDHEFVRNTRNRDRLALAMCEGIRDYLNLEGRAVPRDANPPMVLAHTAPVHQPSWTEVYQTRIADTLTQLEQKKGGSTERSLSQNLTGAADSAGEENLLNADQTAGEPVPDPNDDPLIVLTDLDGKPGPDADQLGSRLKEADRTRKSAEETPAGPALRDHKIQRKETLSIIAKKYNITVDELRRLNSAQLGRGSVIQVGETLKVPGAAAAAPAETLPVDPGEKTEPVVPKAKSKPSTAEDKVKPANPFITYKVQRGDTLDKIASRYNTTPENLRRINNLKRTLIHPGDTIQIASDGTGQDPKLPEKKLASAKPVEYEVKNNDTLGDIATKFQVSLRSLKQFNGLKNNRIDVGQVIRIPH